MSNREIKCCIFYSKIHVSQIICLYIKIACQMSPIKTAMCSNVMQYFPAHTSIYILVGLMKKAEILYRIQEIDSQY